MIKLFLNGQPVALFADTKIGITAMNPYFNENEGFSYTFTIPYKPNKSILQNSARIQSTVQTKNLIWDAILEVDGIQILIGEAVAEGDFAIKEDNFPIVLRSGKTSFAKWAELNKMQNIDFGEDIGTAYTDEQARFWRAYTLGGYYPNYNYVCAPYYNLTALSEIQAYWHTPNYINEYDAGEATMKGMDENHRSHLVTYNFYVRYILKRIVEIGGYTLDIDELADIAQLSKWFMLSLNYLDGQKPVYKYAFPLITVREFLAALRQLGIVVVTNDKKKTASIKFVKTIFEEPIFNNTLNDKSLLETIVFSIPPEGYSIEYSESCDDYITEILGPNITIETINDFSSLPEPSASYSGGWIQKTITAEKYYKTILAEKVNEADLDVWLWKEISQYRKIIVTNEDTPISINIAAIGQRWETQEVTRTVTLPDNDGPITITKTWDINIEMPTLDMVMNSQFQSNSTGNKYEDFPIILLFNLGMKTYICPDDARVIVQFPVISADCYDREENDLGTISMRTEGAKSILTQLVMQEQNWILVRKQSRRYFRMTVAAYTNFDWTNTYCIENVNYLVNSLVFDITANGISLVEAELYTIT